MPATDNLKTVRLRLKRIHAEEPQKQAIMLQKKGGGRQVEKQVLTTKSQPVKSTYSDMSLVA